MEGLNYTYGSDAQGLIWAYKFVPGKPAEAIDTQIAEEWLLDPKNARKLTDELDEDTVFLWLHFSLSNAGSVEWMQQNLKLPVAFYDSLHEGVGSTRVEQDDDTLVAVIHDVLFDFSFDASAVSTLSLCITPNILVSARLRALRSVDQLRANVKSGTSFRSAADLFGHLLRDQASVLTDIVRKTTTRVDAIEDKLLANRVSTSRGELGALRRVLVRLQRLLAPEPAALFRLLSHPPEWLPPGDLKDLHEAAEEFSATVVDSASLVERVKLLQEELTALLNEQTNKTLFVLTVVTVLAIPFTVVSGLFGMNVGGIPFSESAHGFAVIVLLLLACTFVLGYMARNRYRG